MRSNLSTGQSSHGRVNAYNQRCSYILCIYVIYMLYNLYISDAALTNYAAAKQNETNRVKSNCGQKSKCNGK